MIRTRFAPSPTGFLHVGGLRAALYCYLFARQKGGVFILRIEDTDQKRAVEGAVENLIATLKWAGLNYDEGPYIQSERTELYQKHAQELLEKGAAYRCFCTAERLTEMRAEQEKNKKAPMYDRLCMHLSKDEVSKKLDEGVPSVVRQKIVDNRTVTWKDIVRGDVQFASSTIDDQVLLKSDNFPTYHLANVVDDHYMEITHVIRGEEWLSSTPKHILLYEAFGWKVPEFAHLPLLLNKDRSKLSKRQGDVAVEDYQAKGYLPEAMVNFIALLGWHPGGSETEEIFSIDELVEKFSLDKVHKAGAVFDLEKLDWVNWQWRKRKFEEMLGTIEEKLLAITSEYISEKWKTDNAMLGRALVTVSEKIIKEPKSATEHIGFYFNEVHPTIELIAREKMKVDAVLAKEVLKKTHDVLEKLNDFSEEKIKESLLELVKTLGLKNGQVFWPVRAALTGEEFSPGVFEVVWALGKEETLKRLSKVIEIL